MEDEDEKIEYKEVKRRNKLEEDETEDEEVDDDEEEEAVEVEEEKKCSLDGSENIRCALRRRLKQQRGGV